MSIKLKITFFILLVYIIFGSFSCSKNIENQQNKLFSLLDDKTLSKESRYAIINQISTNYLNRGETDELILFLTDYVEKNPDDIYNPYWLLMVASTYLDNEAEPFAEYYFDKIIQNYDDLLVKGKSVHIICLQHLIQISTKSENRIYYFNKLISGFQDQVSTTELYARIASEYEAIGDWENALLSYSLFLGQPDATTIQIAGLPDAYLKARKTIDFNNSDQNWTFQTLEELEAAIKSAIKKYDARKLDKYRSQVNFFGMSWKQDETDTNSQFTSSMKEYMRGAENPFF